MNLTEISTFLAMSIALNFFVLVILFLANFRNIKNQFSDVRKKTWVLLIFIFLLGLFLRFSIPHYHKMYIDEHWDMEVGKNILLKGKAEICQYFGYDDERCQLYPKGIVGVPFIYAISFLIFGINNFVAIDTSAFFGTLSIILVFLVGFLLFKDKNVGLFSSLFFSLLPLHLFWSASAETHVISIFFLLLTLLSFLIYFKVNNSKMLLLAITSLTFTLQTRAENTLLIPLMAIMFLLFHENWKEKIKTKKFWIPWLICGVFFISWFFQVSSSYELDKRSAKDIGNKNLSLGHFGKNFLEYTLRIITGFYFPLILNIFTIIGLLNFRRNKNSLIFITLYFLLFFIFFMFHYKMQDRFLLPSSIGLIFLASYGALKILNKIKKSRYGNILATLLLTLVLISFYPYLQDVYSKNPEISILETKVLELAEKEIPKECYVIAQEPSVLISTTEIKAISTFNAINNPEIVENIINKTSCVLYFEDMLSFHFENERKIIKERYNLIPFLEYKSEDEKVVFTFHKILNHFSSFPTPKKSEILKKKP